ncbi:MULTISPECIES: helix-turn-helix transcriptional regulator [unclassified Pseudovibrio]|uniref:helix-turn-helix domain-containing protein n=1 Tax=unclassified Pseudovibrio TaxID=2627060 RepID=UPI0007AE7FA6|nr:MULTISPECIES: helix-turn-helix transcriptional regulator [unclassified Pseudovibrio]KZK85739.1 helix-turn-helix protein [Pseudovibrio sp. Ad46]KZL10680.1 helix-turn-helix protein [Pseudovibrio sp. Ad26]
MDNQSVKDLRVGLGWSQYELADYLGVKQPTVARIELGQEVPGPIKRLLYILKAQENLPQAA